MTQDAKGQDDPKLKGAAGADDGKDGGADDKPEIDPTIAAIMKDPDAVKKLLDQKRTANAEAKQFREKLEAAAREQSAKDEAKLKEDGKFKELAEKAQQKAEQQKAAFTKRAIASALMAEAVRQGIVDPDAVSLADASKLKVDDDFNVEGAADSIAALKKAKPYLFEKKDDGQPPPEGDGIGRPGIRDRVVKPDDDKISSQDRLARAFTPKK